MRKDDFMLKEELDVIKQAILNELEGYEFYKMAAKQAGTGTGGPARNRHPAGRDS